MRLYDIFRASSGVNTDTRTLRPGQLFFALKGENFDGNAYALQALEAGAAYAVVNDTLEAEDPRLIKVPDTLAALKELAAWHRNHVCGDRHLPVVGLTGTNGKTTTKELIRAVLSRKFKVVATEGNLNNDIGVPLSVLKITPDTEIAVIEMGANHPDDISALTPVSQPDFGLITNVGKAHLLGFGSFEGVRRAKGQLYDYIEAHGESVFINADDPVLTEMASERCLITVPYGIRQQGAEILPITAEHPLLRIRLQGRVIKTHLAGAYNATNVLAAITVGRHFGVSFADAVAAVEEYVPANNRSQMTRTSRNILIEDAYNANPSSMAAALESFAAIREPSKVVLLGDMRELGAESLAEHRAVVRRLAAMDLAGVCLVGEEFTKAVAEEKASFACYPSSDALCEALQAKPLAGCTILVKGSRGIRMEKVIPAL
jgi:UDP-N-acetylmuramoyl-tripeptide--D-alanyl-D-alanine ligase